MMTLFVTSDFPPIISGIATQLYNTWKNLPPEKIIILGPKVAGWETFDSKQNFKIFRCRLPLSNSLFARMAKTLLFIFYIGKLRRKEKIGKIHCGAPLSAGIAGLVFKKFFNVPYCVYVYGGEIKKYERIKGAHWLMRLILNNVQKIIANSIYTRDEFIKFGISPQKFVVINPGVNVQKFAPISKVPEIEKVHNLKNKKVILSVAR